MSAVETVDEVVATGPRPNSPGSPRRTVVSETVQAASAAQADVGGTDDDVREGGHNPRVFKDSTIALLDKLDAGDDDVDSAETVVDPDDVGLDDDAVKVAAKTPAAKPADPNVPPPETKVVDEAAGATDEIRATVTRLQAANEKLLADYEAVKEKPRGEMSAREKAFDDADKMYLDDSIGAIRILMATALGVAADSKEIDAELSGLYTDLTARELNVPLGETHKAARDVARARQMLARDKRERKAESEAAANRGVEDQDTRKANDCASFIEKQLTPLKGSYPLLTTLANDIDGMAPEMLIWRAIERDTKLGILDPKMSDDKMIATVAKSIEDHYDALREKIIKAKPVQPDTTQPTKTVVTASQDQRQSPGARTITNATSSVAPATLPAKKPAPTQEQRPKFKSKKEAQDWALNRHFPE